MNKQRAQMMANVLAAAVVAQCTVWSKAEAQPSAKIKTATKPRIVLTPELQAAWKQAAGRKNSAVSSAISTCDFIAANPAEYSREGYMGMEWAKAVQHCLIAWVATSKARYADTALSFFDALLNDAKIVGDGAGGDAIVTRDSGYSMRMIGPYTALAYDWLRDYPGMTTARKANARSRWKAWIAWYLQKGYLAHRGGSNYHAGFLLAATMIAAAQRDEGNSDADELWQQVTTTLWTTDMAAALARGGIMDGGDWAEGWQYGPLSVASYALGARILSEHGIAMPLISAYMRDVYRRHVAAMLPSGATFANGDNDAETAHIEVSRLTLAATAIAVDAEPFAAMAAAEISTLVSDTSAKKANPFILFEALALDGRAATPTAGVTLRGTNATWYRAEGTKTLYARTSWGADPVYAAFKCAGDVDVDHMNMDAGNFVLSRGRDDLIIDPSPYGSLSTTTSNAPAIASTLFPDEYLPSQGSWAKETGWKWAHQMDTGVMLARCDYADQFRFQETPSDVPAASRDFILLPTINGKQQRGAILLVVDEVDVGKATTRNRKRDLQLRFRVPGTLALQNQRQGSTTIGSSRLTIENVPTGAPAAVTIVASTLKDCWGNTVTRGNCNAARVPVNDLTTLITGPTATSVHVISADGVFGTTVTPTLITGSGTRLIVAVADDVAVWSNKTATLSYQVARPKSAGTHVISDIASTATVSTTLADGKCQIAVSGAHPATNAAPIVVTMDAQCISARHDQRRPMIGESIVPQSNQNVILAAGSKIDPVGALKVSSIDNAKPVGKRAGKSGCCDSGESRHGALSAVFGIAMFAWAVRRRSARPAR